MPHQPSKTLYHPIQIWARVTRGLEWVAAAEASLDSNITHIHTSARNLFFQCQNMADAYRLRCIDDAYLMWGQTHSIDHTRGALDRIACFFQQMPPPPNFWPRSFKHIRVTTSIIGKHNYSRYEVEDVVGHVLSKRFKLKYMDSKSPEVEETLWCRFHIENQTGLIGLRSAPTPLHRRDYRTRGLKGALHPPVAAAMALLADLHPGQDVLDPFAGSGTILVESGLQTPALNLIGYDICESAVSHATFHAKQAGIPLKLIHSDATQMPLVQANRIISNPPWGRAVQAGGKLDLNHIIVLILKNLAANGRAVLLMDAEIDVLMQLRQADLNAILLETLRIAGRLTHLVVVGHDALLTQTTLGQCLQKAWQTHRI